MEAFSAASDVKVRGGQTTESPFKPHKVSDPRVAPLWRGQIIFLRALIEVHSRSRALEKNQTAKACSAQVSKKRGVGSSQDLASSPPQQSQLWSKVPLAALLPRSPDTPATAWNKGSSSHIFEKEVLFNTTSTGGSFGWKNRAVLHCRLQRQMPVALPPCNGLSKRARELLPASTQSGRQLEKKDPAMGIFGVAIYKSHLHLAERGYGAARSQTGSWAAWELPSVAPLASWHERALHGSPGCITSAQRRARAEGFVHLFDKKNNLFPPSPALTLSSHSSMLKWHQPAEIKHIWWFTEQ